MQNLKVVLKIISLVCAAGTLVIAIVNLKHKSDTHVSDEITVSEDM